MAENTRTDYGTVPAAVCGTQEKPYCKRRTLPVQEYLSAGNHHKILTIYQ